MLNNELRGRPIYDEFMAVGNGPHNSFLAMFFENGIIAIAIYIVLFIIRVLRTKSPPNFFDVSLVAFLVFMSTDAINSGGITFLGFFLGVCFLSVDAQEK